MDYLRLPRSGRVKKMYANVFCKDNGDYKRYWLSISTETYDRKKKRPTGEYVTATIAVRLSEKAAKIFGDNCAKTKSKDGTWGRFNITEHWLEAVDAKEGEPYVRCFVLDMVPAEDSE